MPYIFGYGSLMNRTSAERTLGRSLCCNEIHHAILNDYIRSWTAKDCVKLRKDEQIIPCDALFLDLTQQQSTQCNGVIIKVDQRELCRLDTREKGYERVAVELRLNEQQTLQGYTYIIPEANKQSQGIILGRYRKLIEDALSGFPESFTQQFWASTKACDEPVVDGDYVFTCCEQNAAAGRSFND